MDARTELLTEIEGFLLTREITETTFGLYAVNDGKFVGRLRRGGNMTINTIDKARAFIRATDSAEEIQ